MDIVVIIATAGRSDLLKRTLHSLSQCQLPAGYRETVVVENGTPGGALETVQSAAPQLRARYMHIAQANRSHAANAALQTVGDCLVFFSDDDVRFAPESLCAYVQAAQQYGAGHFFGGPVSVDHETPPPQWLVEFLPYSVIGWDLNIKETRIDDRPAHQVKYLGSNWATFAADLRAAGGYNPNLGPGSPAGSTGDETELQRRLTKRGLRGVYVPAARIWHYVPSERCSPGWAIERVYRHGIHDGLTRQKVDSKSWRKLRWRILRRYYKGMLRDWILRISGNDHQRFKAKYLRSYDQGLMFGIRSHNGNVEPLA